MVESGSQNFLEDYIPFEDFIPFEDSMSVLKIIWLAGLRSPGHFETTLLLKLLVVGCLQ